MLLSSKVDYKIQLDVEMKQISKLKPLKRKKKQCSLFSSDGNIQKKKKNFDKAAWRAAIYSILPIAIIDRNRFDYNFWRKFRVHRYNLFHFFSLRIVKIKSLEVIR